MKSDLMSGVAPFASFLAFSPIAVTTPAAVSSVQHVTNAFIQGNMKYVIPISASQNWNITRRINFLSKLKENWDGDGADIPNEQTFFNVNRFLSSLPADVLSRTKEDDINLTPYGTVVLDFQKGDRDLISVEIGKDKIGFFTDLSSGRNKKSTGIKFGVDDIPKELIPVLNEFMDQA